MNAFFLKETFKKIAGMTTHEKKFKGSGNETKN